MTLQIIRFSAICKKRLHFLSKNQYCCNNLRDLGERSLPGNLMGSLSAMLLSEPTCTTVPYSALSSVTDSQRQVPTPRNKTSSLSSRPGHPSSENIQSNLLKVILIFPGQMGWCFWDWQIDANLPGVGLHSGSVELQLHSVVFSLCHSSFLPHRIFNIEVGFSMIQKEESYRKETFM